jgi:hypothetical protein
MLQFDFAEDNEGIAVSQSGGSDREAGRTLWDLDEKQKEENYERHVLTIAGPYSSTRTRPRLEC